MITKKDLEKYLQEYSDDELGPRVGVVVPDDTNKVLLTIIAEYNYKDKPTKEELIIAALRRGLNMQVSAK